MTQPARALEAQSFDVLIIGGGITGACLACDAAWRGYRVALVEQGDYGAATSACSSKLLHGGLRYLQKLRFGKVRESALERIYFQNLAPHLTRYVPFVVPAYRGVARSRVVLSAGMLAYETLCLGQNDLVRHASKRVPAGRGLRREEILEMVPGVAAENVTGGRLFYESHMVSSERMTLAFLDAAARAGAVVRNYTRVDRFLRKGNDVVGVEARDALDDAPVTVRARLTLNAAGPWLTSLNSELIEGADKLVTGLSRGAHIVTRAIVPEVAVALPTRRQSESFIDRGGRHVFVIPWRGHSLIGTTYGPHTGGPEILQPTANEMDDLIADINDALGPGTLQRDDVRHAFVGLYPLVARDIDPEVYQGTGDFRIVDHAQEHGVGGLVSVFGAKYTTARLVAELAMDRVAARLSSEPPPCSTRTRALPSGEFEDPGDFIAALAQRYPWTDTALATHLTQRYGTTARDVARLLDANEESREPLTEERATRVGEVEWAVRREHARHLEDFVFRRTGMGTIGNPGEAALRRTASLMAEALGRGPGWVETEVESTLSRFPV